MSRRDKSPEPSATHPMVEATPDPRRPGGKGRPTPTRKEAEAAARARAKVPRTRKEMAAAKRAARAEANQRMREAMKTGDDRHLPARDRGPVKRFIRDFVDSRFSFIELLIPLMLVTLILGWTGNAYLAGVGNTMLLGGMVIIIFNAIFLRFQLRRELTRRFPDAPVKGTTYYAVMRSFQMKFMRLPKAQVRIGEKLPEHYR